MCKVLKESSKQILTGALLNKSRTFHSLEFSRREKTDSSESKKLMKEKLEMEPDETAENETVQ